ncbi:hypothetical protein [Prosthecobacter sp.]|uniref:hypothetical protein n=1 Tax=Prosthecobacter sp. TaxID=1965333 RepID=UPI003783EA61
MHLSLLPAIAATLLLTSCAASMRGMSAPTDPATHPQAVVFPLFDLRTDKSTKLSCDAARPISERFLGGQIQCVVHQAANEGLRANFTPQDLAAANRAVLKKIPNKGEQYAFAIVVSHWEFASAATRFKYDLSAYLVRIADGEIVWQNRLDKSLWRGVIQGPLEKLQGGGLYDFQYGNALMQLVTKTPKNLPR